MCKYVYSRLYIRLRYTVYTDEGGLGVTSPVEKRDEKPLDSVDGWAAGLNILASSS